MCRELDFHNEKEAGVLYRLVAYVTLELAYQKEHAKLQARAHEWVIKARPAGLLLQGGADVKEKKRWLEQARKGEQDPPPTALQDEYVEESRKRRISVKRVKRVCCHLATLPI